ncbi:hypothetical protein [Actinomadura parmotrematis]|uniref:Mce-associated membrane protein n=1 Tax=Actinomadura parmotrematis TaxID=2864039 RepID=A0ABS7G0W5_9ACTN|nr:hypothetical protein [Actinomadura parmotrematis]MBW8486350.1 hypothetical protein [Actinomadura parmotrematis]
MKTTTAVAVKKAPAKKAPVKAPAKARIPEVSPEVWAASLAAVPAAPPPRRTSLRRRILLLAPVAALVAASAALGAVWEQKDDLAADARQRRDLAASATKVTGVFFNWDYRHMDQAFAAKYPLLTTAAADAIRPTAATLTSYFSTNKVSSKAAVSGVYPGEIKGRDANVMVVINTKVTSAKTIQSNTGATVALSMKRVSGRWLAQNITLLSQGVEATTDLNGKPVANGGNGIPSTGAKS